MDNALVLSYAQIGMMSGLTEFVGSPSLVTSSPEAAQVKIIKCMIEMISEKSTSLFTPLYSKNIFWHVISIHTCTC
jgi:hypothetical protein